MWMVGLPFSLNNQASFMHWVGMPSTPGDARLFMLLITVIIPSTVKGVFKAKAAFFFHYGTTGPPRNTSNALRSSPILILDTSMDDIKQSIKPLYSGILIQSIRV